MAAQIPLPAFRQPPGLDGPLPQVPATSPPASPESSPPDLRPPAMDEDSRPEILEPSSTPSGPGRRTRISSAGERAAAAQLIHGLLIVISTAAAALLRRRGLVVRQPTGRQLDDVANPLGAIAARHLPMELISEDLLDAATATAAAHTYATDGPLIERTPTAEDYA